LGDTEDLKNSAYNLSSPLFGIGWMQWKGQCAQMPLT